MSFAEKCSLNPPNLKPFHQTQQEEVGNPSNERERERECIRIRKQLPQHGEDSRRSSWCHFRSSFNSSPKIFLSLPPPKSHKTHTPTHPPKILFKTSSSKALSDLGFAAAAANYYYYFPSSSSWQLISHREDSWELLLNTCSNNEYSIEKEGKKQLNSVKDPHKDVVFFLM